MKPLDNATGGIDERSTERMHFRAKPHVKRAIQRAAALSGVDDSVFTMNAAYRQAMETIAAHESTALLAVDHEAFFSAIENPPEPEPKLREAFERHGRTIVSR